MPVPVVRSSSGINSSVMRNDRTRSPKNARCVMSCAFTTHPLPFGRNTEGDASCGGSRDRVRVFEFVATRIGRTVLRGAGLIGIEDAGGDCLAVTVHARVEVRTQEVVNEKFGNVGAALFGSEQLEANF